MGFTILFFLSKYVLSFQPSSSKPASQPSLSTNMVSFIYVFYGHHQMPFCCVTHNFVFRQESGSYTACFSPPFVALLQIMITSCKAICFETLCWWPPMFNWGPGRLMMNFPNLHFCVVCKVQQKKKYLSFILFLFLLLLLTIPHHISQSM